MRAWRLIFVVVFIDRERGSELEGKVVRLSLASKVDYSKTS